MLQNKWLLGSLSLSPNSVEGHSLYNDMSPKICRKGNYTLCVPLHQFLLCIKRKIVCTSRLRRDLEHSWLTQQCGFVRKYNEFLLPFDFRTLPLPRILH